MEMLFIVLISLTEHQSLNQFEMHEYYQVAESVKVDKPCAEFVRSAAISNFVKTRAIGNRQYRVGCVPASQLADFSALLQSSQNWKLVTGRTEISAREELVSGILTYDPGVSGRQSVDAYLGKALTLKTKERGVLVLFPGKGASLDQLKKYSGKSIKLKVMAEDRTPGPDSVEAYPTDINGKPLRRAGYLVLQILE